jgi:CheY-specific phosphatase CheX
MAFGANTNNTLRRGGCDLSIVPPVVLVGRVAAEK